MGIELAEREIDGMRPSSIVRPATVEELAAAIRAANAEHRAVVLWGGGTRIGVGDAPARYDSAIEMRGLAGIVQLDPEDLVCTVRAGTTVAELREALAPHGLGWPVEPGLPSAATVGGTIASAAAGPERLRYQHVRDWVIGCRAVLGDGTVTHAGGRVVKNVSGYDLARLYSGSYGTLAAIAEVSLKLWALPERTATLSVGDVSARDALRLAGDLRAAHVPLDALAISLAADEGATVHVRIAGSTAGTERVTRTVRERASAAVESSSTCWSELPARTVSDDWVARIASPAGRELPSGVLDGDAVVYAGTGVAYLLTRRDPDAFARLRAEIEGLGGAVVLERATPEYKSAAGGAWGKPGAPRSILRALKERFDPNGVLSPGRVPS